MHQLRAHNNAVRAVHVEQLVALGTPVLPLLSRIAAVHAGQPDGGRAFRTGWVAAEEAHLFPPPDAVDLLLTLLLRRIEDLWKSCLDPKDDILVAVFAVYGLLKIHPFDDGNGRTALDFAQALLMYRWKLGALPWTFPKDLHGEVGRVMQTAAPNSNGDTAADAVELANSLGSVLRSMDIEALRAHPSFALVAHWLGHALLPDTADAARLAL